jgi:hypothetical protein
MKDISVFALAAAVSVSGCVGQQSQTIPQAGQSGVSSSLKQSRLSSWMAPAVSSSDLLYVTNANGTVTVYSYPKGKLVGTLTGFEDARGACVDKAGNVYITDGNTGTISEFAHGATKPLRKVRDLQYRPNGCSIDPVTGNLAVSNYETDNNYPGNLSIYRRAKGFARAFIAQDFYYYLFTSYDGTGNAYVDGLFSIYGENFEFATLHKKSGTLNNVTLPANINYPGGIVWDGKYLAVGDQATQTIYEFAIANGKFTLHNTTVLNGAVTVEQFAIDGATLVAPNQGLTGNSNVLFYNYPAGGSPTKTITNGIVAPRAVAISLALR